MSLLTICFEVSWSVETLRLSKLHCLKVSSQGNNTLAVCGRRGPIGMGFSGLGSPLRHSVGALTGRVDLIL